MGTQAFASSYLANQLRVYSLALNTIRRADIRHPEILPTFWTCLFMLLENDGKNRYQLGWAGLDNFVDEFVRTRLYEGSTQLNGWPSDNTLNSLALWLMWMTTTSEKLESESPQRRHQIIQLVLPYVVLPFRYPTAIVPHNHYSIPLSETFNQQFPRSVLTAHGSYPLYRNNTVHTFSHYDRDDLKMDTPLISIAAKLLYFSRRGVVPLGVPPHLPYNRAHALQLGFNMVGPTQEDIHELNAHKFAKLVPRMQWDWRAALTDRQLALDEEGFDQSASVQWENDWSRLTECIDPFSRMSIPSTKYAFGLLDGLWQGRLLVPNEPDFVGLITQPQRPANFSEMNPLFISSPVYMRLREQHCIDPQEPVACGGNGDNFDDGLTNAWMPLCKLREEQGKVMVEDNQGNASTYERYVPGEPNSHDEDTCGSCQYRGTSDIVYRGRPGSPECDYEADFESVGLGRRTEGEDEDEDEIMEDVDDDMEGLMEYCVSAECSGILDIVLTGETDLNHSRAWNPYKFYGRVRLWDGLIAIVRVPVNNGGDPDRRFGRWIFTGYVVGGQNFVGTWRSVGSDVSVGVPTWESAFVMSRRE
ncbi:hypothetical protein SERLADRAFT_353830 [Serpula lacrymans var. lacrymans S7.9]|nr:uncharacterized protein SERLADRAFT_353830 [Serpula lacrymans var. lacrymans S7.9]EGO31272.1 hypothetical protein SERLADRAFT_353830 [Serpula lacrymans var. lacrymans S7.9]